MLDVILTVLSILGIILLVLLGIILVILLIVLFFPISYKARGQKNTETFWVEAKANWLFRLVRVRFFYPKPGNVVVKILWFTLYDSKAEKKEKKGTAGSEAAGSTLEVSSTDTSAKDSAEHADGDDERVSTSATGENVGGDSAGSTVETATDGAVSDNTADIVAGSEPEASAHVSQDNVDVQGSGKKPGICKKISKKIDKVKFKILNIYGKIKYIWENIKFYKELLQEEQTQALLKHLMLRLKKILWSIRPRRINADIVFGAASPDTTGYCMAVYGILFPILGKQVRFTPDFEQAVFKGEFSLAGHITLFTLVLHAGIFALDKKLRLLIAKVKKFHKKESQNK